MSYFRRRPYILSLGVAILIVGSIGFVSYRDWRGSEQAAQGTRQARANLEHQTSDRFAILFGTGVLTLLLAGAAIHVHYLITSLERASRYEQRQKATLQTTLRSIGDAIIATDEEGRITFTNPLAEKLTGWTAAQAGGRALGDVFRVLDETTRTPLDNCVAEVLRGVAGLANHILLAKDGREIPIDCSAAPITGEHGIVAGVIFVFRDVTAQRQAQQVLENSERHYRLLFEHNPQPMYVYDQGTLQFLAVNNAAEEKYGYSMDEFLAMTLLEIRPPEDIPKLLEATSVPTVALNTAGTWRHRRKDGKIFTVEITEHPIVFEDHTACLVLVNDITERQKLEEQFHQAQRLESIGRLAGGVAHDFNNILTVINGYADMLRHQACLDETARESLSEIRSAGERAAGLTQQLLAFSRRQIVQPAVVNLNNIVGDIEKMLRRIIGEDVTLVTKLAPDLGNILADAGQLQQILMNLAVNSRDAMPGGGKLVIETSNANVDDTYAATRSGLLPGPHIVLAVSDTGAGMSAEVQERLFEPFFTTKPKGAGTGLGLATVYGMVKQSGGSIWVYSEPGLGTTFKTYFPTTDKPFPRAQGSTRTELAGNETILVVEDQPEVRALAVSALEKYGFTVHAAGNGDEALAFCVASAGAIDLLVTDVIMPGMNGRDLAQRLTALRPDMRVLFMSGYTDDAIAHHGVLDAGVAYIPKPFTPESLAKKVREVLGPAATATILIVEEEVNARRFLREALTSAGYAILEAADARQAVHQLIHAAHVDLAIAQLAAHGEDGLETVSLLHEHSPQLKVITISGAPGDGHADAAALLGAVAALGRPIQRDDLLQAVRHTLAS